MPAFRIHKDATVNMKQLALYVLPYGRGDAQSAFWDKVINYNRKKIKSLITSSVDARLELQKMVLIDIAGHYIADPNPADSTDKTTMVTNLRTAIIGELDSAVDTYYSGKSYVFDVPTTP